jgi:hypothetical protein
VDLGGRGAGLHPGWFASDPIPGQSDCRSIPEPNPITVSYGNLDAHSDIFPNTQPNSLTYAITYVKPNSVRFTDPDMDTNDHHNTNRNPSPNQHTHADRNRDTRPNQHASPNFHTHRNPYGYRDPYPYRDVYSFTYGYANGNAGLLRPRRFRRRPTE